MLAIKKATISNLHFQSCDVDAQVFILEILQPLFFERFFDRSVTFQK